MKVDMPFKQKTNQLSMHLILMIVAFNEDLNHYITHKSIRLGYMPLLSYLYILYMNLEEWSTPHLRALKGLTLSKNS